MRSVDLSLGKKRPDFVSADLVLSESFVYCFTGLFISLATRFLSNLDRKQCLSCSYAIS